MTKKKRKAKREIKVTNYPQMFIPASFKSLAAELKLAFDTSTLEEDTKQQIAAHLRELGVKNNKHKDCLLALESTLATYRGASGAKEIAVQRHDFLANEKVQATIKQTTNTRLPEPRLRTIPNETRARFINRVAEILNQYGANINKSDGGKKILVNIFTLLAPEADLTLRKINHYLTKN